MSCRALLRRGRRARGRGRRLHAEAGGEGREGIGMPPVDRAQGVALGKGGQRGGIHRGEAAVEAGRPAVHDDRVQMSRGRPLRSCPRIRSQAAGERGTTRGPRLPWARGRGADEGTCGSAGTRRTGAVPSPSAMGGRIAVGRPRSRRRSRRRGCGVMRAAARSPYDACSRRVEVGKEAPRLRGGIEARGLGQPYRAFRDSDLEPRRGDPGLAGGGPARTRENGREDEGRSQRPAGHHACPAGSHPEILNEGIEGRRMIAQPERPPFAGAVF